MGPRLLVGRMIWWPGQRSRERGQHPGWGRHKANKRNIDNNFTNWQAYPCFVCDILCNKFKFRNFEIQVPRSCVFAWHRGFSGLCDQRRRACVAASQVTPGQGILPGPVRVLIGPGRFFRPTSGLCALFAKTGTRVLPNPITHTPRAPTLHGRTYAKVLRAKAMAAPGSGGRGGGRADGGFNPGFNPGFTPGNAGRGQPPRGREAAATEAMGMAAATRRDGTAAAGGAMKAAVGAGMPGLIVQDGPPGTWRQPTGPHHAAPPQQQQHVPQHGVPGHGAPGAQGFGQPSAQAACSGGREQPTPQAPAGSAPALQGPGNVPAAPVTGAATLLSINAAAVTSESAPATAPPIPNTNESQSDIPESSKDAPKNKGKP